MMKKIDMHVHTRKNRSILREGTNQTYATPEQLIEMYDKLGIEKGVILPGIKIECAFHFQSNEEVIDIVTKYPERFDWFCNIDPRMGSNSPYSNLSYYIQYYKEKGAKGVGEIFANLYFDDPLVENLFYHCETSNMPLIFHIGPQIGGCYGLVDELELYRLEKELKKYPKLKFLGHSMAFWSEISADVTQDNRNLYPKGKVKPGRVIELMKKYPNLYGDLSANSGYNALERDPKFGYAFIEEFQDQLFFGTDICSPSDDRNLSYWLDEAVATKKISSQAYSKICRDNALKLLSGD